MEIRARQIVNVYNMTSIKMLGLLCARRWKKEIEGLWNNKSGSKKYKTNSEDVSLIVLVTN